MWKQSVLRSAAVALSMMAAFAYAADKTEKSDKGGQAQLSKDDRNFIMEAAQGGMMEVQMGKLAQEKGQSDGVKQFGKRLEAAHSKANDELKGIAQKLGVTLPAALDKKHQGKVDKMSKAKPQDFDRQFSREMVDDHEKDVKDADKLAKEARKEKQADLAAFLEQTHSGMQTHLQEAKRVDKIAKAEKKSGQRQGRTPSTSGHEMGPGPGGGAAETPPREPGGK